MPHQPGDNQGDEDHRGGERQVPPLEAGEAAQQPEHGAADLGLVLGAVDDHHGDGGEQRAHAHADEDQLDRAAAPAHRPDHQEDGQHGAAECEDRHIVGPQESQSPHDDGEDRTGAGPGGHTQDRGPPGSSGSPSASEGR